ncbi:hypothetical protein FACS1894122_00230 [Alphaproteobacteria bacterium]|nr:hypothetical protein FACS1894122_00150 [Alphaproteobacteria bacterium]GHT90322.1 hypothetical protein FACS1894122_00230 [Alphaproteobacteria bacterium]
MRYAFDEREMKRLIAFATICLFCDCAQTVNREPLLPDPRAPLELVNQYLPEDKKKLYGQLLKLRVDPVLCLQEVFGNEEQENYPSAVATLLKFAVCYEGAGINDDSQYIPLSKYTEGMIDHAVSAQSPRTFKILRLNALEALEKSRAYLLMFPKD